MKLRTTRLLVCCSIGLLFVALTWISIGSVQATDYLEGIIDIYPGSGSSYPKYLTVYDGVLYFQADDGTHGKELWSYDGVTATLVADIQTGSAEGDPRNLIVYDGALYFSAVDAVHGRELWVYDGVTVTRVHDVYPGSASGLSGSAAVYDHALYFAANDGVYGDELCRYDGVTVTRVADIFTGSGSANPSQLFVHDGALYFRADDGSHGYELWSYDGVTTTLVSDIYTGTGSGYPGHFASYEDELFFGAQDADYQYHLYRYDGSAVTRVGTQTYINPGPEHLTVYDGALYFKNSAGTYGYELWRYDGHLPERVTDIDPGSGSAYPNYLTAFAGKLYFYAYESTYGYELWSYHDGAAHFELNINTIPASASSYPSEFTPLGDQLYFRANDGDKGYELTRITPTPLLGIRKRASDVTPVAGQRITYTFTVEHPGGKPLTGVTLSDTLPAGLTFAGPVTLEPAQPGAGLATSATDLPRVAWNLALSTGMRVTVTLPVTVDAALPAGTQLTNTIVVTSTQAPDRTSTCVVTIGELSCVPISNVNLTPSTAGELTAGATVRFLADAQGGTRPVAYTWTLDGTAVPAAGEVYEHTFVEAGSFTITVTATNACNTEAVTTTVTVLPAASDRPDLSPSQLWVNRFTAEAGDVLTYTIILRNQTPVTATATVTNTRPDYRYASVVPGSAHASDGGTIHFEEDYWVWSGQVVSGTPVLLTYAVTVLSPPQGTLLRNVARVADGTGRVVRLDAETAIVPDFGLLVNDGAAYTNIPTVTLTYTWNNTSVITEANLGSCSGSVCRNSGWLTLPVTPTTAVYTPWSMDVSGDRRLLYTAWVVYRNGAGETVGPFYDAILYDPQPPDVTGLEFVTGTARTGVASAEQVVAVRVTTRDANTGVDALQVSGTPDFATFIVVPVQGPVTEFAWALSEGESIYVRAVDRAGNLSSPVAQSYGSDHGVFLPFVVRGAP